MNPLVWLAALPLLAGRFVGRPVRRVLPVGRHGIHILFEGCREGLRLDTRPRGGALLALADSPPRLRGGSGVWPDLTAAADRDLRAARLAALDGAPSEVAVSARFEDGARLTLLRLPGGTAWLFSAGPKGDVRALGGGRRPPDAARERLERIAWHTEPAGLARRLASWTAAGGAPDPERLRGLVPGLPAAERRRLAAAALGDGSLFRRQIVDRLSGHDRPVGLLRGQAPAIDLLAETGEPRDGLLDALPEWYEAALAVEAREERLSALSRVARTELARARRALAALEREEAGSPAPERLRRDAEALLASGPAAEPLPGGGFRVPDPREPSRSREVRSAPGTGWRELADALYARARRVERGRAARGERRAELARRAAELESVLRELAPPAGEAALDRAASRLADAGIALEANAPRAGRGESGPALRLFRSPAGFEVLAGRSARQNERLTFGIAAPDDLWLHALGRPGAHVLLRLAGRKEVPEEDILFAARIAARYSRSAPGEPVDVLVARRRHVRRLRGGQPGQVTVRKSRTVRVAAAEELPAGEVRPRPR